MQVTVRVERYADQGRCVGHVNGQVIFLRFALPGELVEASVDLPVRSNRRFLTGEVTKVLEASPDRVSPAWSLAGPLAWGGGLGGADLVHVSLAGQLNWKKTIVQEQFERLGHVSSSVDVIRPEGDEELGGLNWRTRIDLIADEKGMPSMRRRESHERVPITSMPLATQELNVQAQELGVWKGGFVPGSSIRISVPYQGCALQDNNFALIVNDETKVGKRKLLEKVTVSDHDFMYEVDAAGFWQVHRQAPALLASEVLQSVQTGLESSHAPVIWDLYSGSGLFTLPLAQLLATGTRVMSIEGSRTAVTQAKRNIEHAGVSSQVTALCGDVAATLAAGVPDKLSQPDVVILDPPRAGAKANVCHQISQSGAPLIIYVSCDPTSLARDTDTLGKEGYQLTHVHSYDIYPMTHHVETLAVFTR